jgi:hypothetical protein
VNVIIEETTVGKVDGVRVGMGNMIVDEYVRLDGTVGRGWVCALAVGGARGMFVGEGSEIEIGGHSWRVVRVEKEPPALGMVELTRD